VKIKFRLICIHIRARVYILFFARYTIFIHELEMSTWIKGSNHVVSKLSVSQYLFSYAEARMLTFQKLLLTGTR